jgi:hypothetical protein
MQYLRPVVALAVPLFLFASMARAQRNECRQLIVPFHIMTRDASPAPSLNVTDVSAIVAARPSRVTDVSGEHQPQRLLLLLDASGSVRGGTVSGWDATVQVGAQLLQDLPALEIGLALFSEEVETIVGPTPDRERLLEAIEGLRAGPRELERGRRQRTALWDSLIDSVSLFGPFRPGDVVYVVTDGVDNHSESRPAAATQVLVAAGIRLFAFAIANEGFAYGTGDLERMVDDTGGSVVAGSARDWRAFRAQEPSPIGSAMAAQYRQLQGFYLLRMEPAEPIARPQPWQLALKDLDEAQAKNLTLSYPLRLFPCN